MSRTVSRTAKSKFYHHIVQPLKYSNIHQFYSDLKIRTRVRLNYLDTLVVVNETYLNRPEKL